MTPNTTNKTGVNPVRTGVFGEQVGLGGVFIPGFIPLFVPGVSRKAPAFDQQ